MTPNQQLLLGVGASKKTYVDEVFSTYVYEGNGSSKSINNGINLSGEGGMVWVKDRDSQTYDEHALTDTVRGIGKELQSNSNIAETTQTTNRVTAFNSNGFTVGEGHRYNKDDDNYASWTFRKAPGFFDVVTYTGNGSNRTIGHSLECKPGMIMIKRRDDTSDWVVWHRGLHITGRAPGDYGMFLNNTDGKDDDNGYFNGTNPTDAVFSVGTDTKVNANSGTYVAYIFAHGDSASYALRAKQSGGNNRAVKVNADNDIKTNTDNTTLECWFKADSYSNTPVLIDTRSGGGNDTTGYAIVIKSDGKPAIYHNGYIATSSATISTGTWYHIAVTKSGTTAYLWLNGVEVANGTIGISLTNNTMYIGCNSDTGDTNTVLTGRVSNVRLSNTTIYTSGHTPPVPEFPLNKQKNTILLCCDKPDPLKGTFVPDAGMSQVFSEDATSESVPGMNETAANVFGDTKDQNIIKCGRYVGTGISGYGYAQLNLGWEPQYLMIKKIGTGAWHIFDSIRGWFNWPYNDRSLLANDTAAEYDQNVGTLQPKGCKLDIDTSSINASGSNYIYMAIRRPDGYVSKPKTGSEVFAIDSGSGSSTIPTFDSGFPVDVALVTKPDDSHDRLLTSRLIGTKAVRANTSGDDTTQNYAKWDSNVGCWTNEGDNGLTGSSAYHAYQWKRYKSFDTVQYVGDGVNGRTLEHNLGVTPEMIWVKNLQANEAWRVYHKSLNGGTTPHNYKLTLDTNAQEATENIWYQTAPTSTHFKISADNAVNQDTKQHMAFLFSSVAGVSAIGTYAGNNSGQTIITGFQPRFVLIKLIDVTTEDWIILDTLRGWGSGNDKRLILNENTAPASAGYGAPTSTGFTLDNTQGATNENGRNYIYYAHA